MGSPPFETGKVAGDASSRFVTEEQQTPAPFMVDSGRTTPNFLFATFYLDF